jgi:RNA polymerase sigma-70 factor, ECF subfamily
MTTLMAESPPTVDVAALRLDLARAVARVCPGWLAADRDDLVQAALMRVLRRLDAAPPDVEREGKAPVAASYLHKVAYSVLIDEIRRVRRRRETSLEAEPAEPPRPQAADPERVAASSEIGRGIQSCLGHLAHDRRLAVTLHLQGHTVVEASRILDWPEKRTENLVYRGLADLRSCLASKGLRP